jgi:hypothetical protein
VKASEEIEADDDMFWLWICSLILMCVWEQSMSAARHTEVVSGCIEDCGTSGSKMRRSEDESDREKLLCACDDRAHQAQPVDISQFQTVVTLSRAAQDDPYNNMHGRGPGVRQCHDHDDDDEEEEEEEDDDDDDDEEDEDDDDDEEDEDDDDASIETAHK